MTNQEKQNWREEFEKKFSGLVQYGHKKIHNHDVHKIGCSKGCVYLNKAIESFIEKTLHQDKQEAIKEIEGKYNDALIWCSGSEDFQVGGKARVGWEKICLPLLKEFPQGKENYCPRCYFECDKVILRINCPHSAIKKVAEDYKNK